MPLLCHLCARSAHTVKVHAAGYSAPVKASNLSPGHTITVEVTGETTMTEVPVAGSYRIYGEHGRRAFATCAPH